MRRILIACASAIALIAASCSSSTTSTDPAGDPTEGSSNAVVAEIRSIGDLRSVFSDDDGMVRIILSMSPT